MQQPIQVTFRGLPVSDVIENACLDEVAKLERYSDRITSCHVTVSVPHRRHHKGNLYEIQIELAVPGDKLVVNRAPAEHHASEDAHMAIRESFDKIRRLLEDHVRRQRGQTKTHGAKPEPDHRP